MSNRDPHVIRITDPTGDELFYNKSRKEWDVDSKNATVFKSWYDCIAYLMNYGRDINKMKGWSIPLPYNENDLLPSFLPERGSTFIS